MQYLMPDYFPGFMCKMGRCRTSCCEGWQVSLSEPDYFRLVGLQCKQSIRRELDCALHLLPNATYEKYAEISHKYDGNCHLRMPDGRCIIQATLGENSMPLICRLYPRAIKNDETPECACSDSCERTIECLLFRKEKLNFITCEKDFSIPDIKGKSIYDEIIPNEQSIRLYLISLIQDRRFSLPQRIFRLGTALNIADEYIKRNDFPDIETVSKTLGDNTYDIPQDYIKTHLVSGLQIMENIISALDRHGATLSGYGESILRKFKSESDIIKLYTNAKESFENKYPGWESGFENILVNHMFITRFPFADGIKNMYDEYLAISSVYTTMRFVSVGGTIDDNSEEHLVDLLSAAFRLIEHTPFHSFGAAVLHREKFISPDDVCVLSHL